MQSVRSEKQVGFTGTDRQSQRMQSQNQFEVNQEGLHQVVGATSRITGGGDLSENN